MKKLYFVLAAISVLAVFNSCKKSVTDNHEYGDSLTEEDNAFLETLSTPNPTLHDILGYDGQPLQRGGQIQGALKKELIDKLLKDAQARSGEKIINHPDEGTNKPAHMGIAYSKGQRNYNSRLIPPYGNAIHRTYAVFGTDCSGLQINLLIHAGINISVDNDVSTFEASLRKALQNGPYSGLTVKNLGHLPLNELQSGDYILWFKPDGNHMGIIATNSLQEKIVYQSNGTGTPADEAAQLKNLGVERGVHPIKLTTAISTNPDPKKSYWGTDYKILRFEEVNSISVSAKVSWLNTGIHVKAGTKIHIQQTGGGWSVDSVHYPFVSADGHTNEAQTPLAGYGNLKTLGNTFFGALLGKVGNTVFKVGGNYETVFTIEGDLFLQINDEARADNGGAVTVKITEN